ELTPSNGGWTGRTLYSFTGGTDGGAPVAGVTFDSSGNLYGTTYHGGQLSDPVGVVFQLTPSGSGWTENVLYTFQNGSDGADVAAGLVFDNSGNLYGAASAEIGRAH